MSQDYSPSLVTKNLVFCGDAAMKSAAGPATLLYDKVNDNNGTMYNGSCISLDGGDENINCGDASDLNVTTGSFTLIGWINNNDIGNYDVIVQKGNAGHGTSPGYRLRWESGNTLMFICTQSSSYAEDNVSTTGALSQDTWYHVAVTRNAGLLSVYIDGALNNSLSSSITGTLTNSEHFVLGYDKYNDSGYFNGQMADWKFFNTALSAANVKELYDDSKLIVPTKNDASGGFVSQSNLKLSLSLSEGAGVVCYDGSGNGNHGTFTNADSSGDWLTGQTGCPQLVEGYNRPMSFDGSDDNVDTNWGASVDPSAGLTVSGWVQASDISASSMWAATYKTNGDRLYLGHYGGKWDFGYKASGWSEGSGQVTGQNNVWTHCCLAMDTTSQILYINGVATITKTESGSYTLPGDMYLGQYGTSASYIFGGLINEVIVYDTKLAIGDVQTLAATGPNGGPLPPDPMSLSNSSNVVGYWRNDGGVTWTDRSGEGNNGTVAGSPDALLFKQGYNGQKNVNTGRDGQGFPLSRQNNGAIGFDGTTTYTDVGSLGGAGTFSNCTISVWVNPQNVFGATDYGRIYDGNYEPSIRQRGPTLQLNGTVAASQTYLFYLGADISNYFSSGNMTAPKGQWTNITMTVVTVGTASQTVVGYVNLTPEGSGSTTDSAKMWVGDIGNLRIGQGYKTGQRFFAGQIANLQIWNRALTYAEIQQNYKAFKNRFGK